MSRGRVAIEQPRGSSSRAAPPKSGPEARRWTVGPVDDPLEREADRVARQVMAGAEVSMTPAAPAIHRKCDACAEEEAVRAKGDSRGVASAGADQAAAAVARGGAPLAAGIRSHFESRLHHDFSGVRVHDDARAAAAAETIHAQAFTVGNDIAFARGAYAPASRDGAQLLAHELVHVVQSARGARRGVIARQAAPFRTRTFRDRSGGGTTDFTETVQNAPTQAGNIISGQVTRTVTAPAHGTAPQLQLRRSTVNVQFDTQACAVRLPFVFNFVPQATANPPFCQDPPNATNVPALSPARVQTIGQQYVDAVRSGLNGQYTARISGCQNNCADREIPIEVNPSISATNPNQTVSVVNRAGRGNASTLCAGSMSSGFAVHESGHQVLGAGDEYRETDPTRRRLFPTRARDERVRTDLTRMGNYDDYRRFAMFQERHFRFAQVFLEAAFPNCTVTLQAVPRRMPDFRAEFLIGGISGGDMYLGGRFDVGIPLTRLREIELRLGAQGLVLTGLGEPRRNALLLGATLALEARTSPTRFAAMLSMFGSAGLYHQFAQEGSVAARSSGYVEGGAALGVTTPMSSGARLHLMFGAAIGRELTREPDEMRWVRYGFAIGGTF